MQIAPLPSGEKGFRASSPKILAAESELAARERELQDAASDPARVSQAYEHMQEAHRRVEDLYARWAELESKVGPLVHARGSDTEPRA